MPKLLVHRLKTAKYLICQGETGKSLLHMPNTNCIDRKEAVLQDATNQAVMNESLLSYTPFCKVFMFLYI